MFSPAAFLRWACAGRFGRLRVLRARRRQAGFLGLAAIVLLAAAWPARGQFPIRQVPAQWQMQPPASPPVAPARTAAGSGPPSQPHPAVCRITVTERDGASYGSGTLIDVRDQFGLVVTNWHVVRDAAGPITVEFPEGHKATAEVIRTDKDWDLAALSILRPKAEPLPISAQAPQPGDRLSIAGYGSGDYRLVSGACTQYVAPSNDLPYEMIELAAEARQGDSGGPILNERGEICGVLFGSGPGYTSGSYGGRVRQFLATVIPGGVPASDRSPPPNQLAAQPATPLTPTAEQSPSWTPRAEVGPPRIDPVPVPQATALHAAASPVPDLDRPFERAENDALTPAAAEPQELAALPGSVPAGDEVDPKAAVERPVAASLPPRGKLAEGEEPGGVPRVHATLPPRETGRNPATVDLNEAPPDQLLAAAWKRLGGNTLFDQVKSVLAIFGLLAVGVQLWRFSSRPEREVEDD